MVASQNGQVEVVDKLLQHGARVDLQEKVSRNMAFLLHLSAYLMRVCTIHELVLSLHVLNTCSSSYSFSELHVYVVCY